MFKYKLLLYEAKRKVFWTRVRFPPGPPIEMIMNITQTAKLAGFLLGTYILYRLGLEVWCIVYGLLY